MSSSSPTRGPARETRLLILTLCVSVAVLFLLARFRFPARPISELATPQPLARLARATTFDDQAAALSELLRRASDASVTLRASGASAESEADFRPGASRLVPALRVRDDLAVAVLAGDARIEAIDGDAVSASPSASPVVARDEVRGLVLVRVPARPTPALAVQPSAEALDVPGFVAIMDATPGGPTIRSQFVSRAATHAHPAWDVSVISLGLGGAPARPGSMIFTLAGRFIGMVLPDEEETLIAPGEALIARADRLAHGESVLAANAGLAVQPLSPAIAKATHASNGVVVAAIQGAVTSAGSGSAPAAAAATGTATPPTLRVGDVIAAIDADAIRSVADWDRLLNRRAPGTTVQLQVVRREGTQQIPLTLKWRDAPLAPGDDGKAAAAASAKRSESAAAALGLTLRATGTGLEVQRVTPGTAAARAGLQSGDRITALPYTASPSAAAASAKAPRASRTSAASAAAYSLALTPPNAPLTVSRVEAAFKALASGDALLMAINRGGQPLVVAIEKP